MQKPLNSETSVLVLRPQTSAQGTGFFSSLENLLRTCGFGDIQSLIYENPKSGTQQTSRGIAWEGVLEVIEKSSKKFLLVLDCREKFLFCDFKLLGTMSFEKSAILLKYEPSGESDRFLVNGEGLPIPIPKAEENLWADGYKDGHIYLLSKSDFLEFSRSWKNFGELLQFLISSKKASGQPMGGPWIQDEGRASPNDIDLKRNFKPCLFLDRDGIIIEDVGYPYQIQDLKIIPAIFPLIHFAKEQGWYVIVVSNQSGLARGKFSQEQLNAFTFELASRLEKEGVAPDHWYYSSFLEDGSVPEFKKKSLSRKPGPGMFLRAMADYDIAIEKSFMIGDRATDVIKIPHLTTLLKRGLYPTDGYPLTFENFDEILNFIKRGTSE